VCTPDTSPTPVVPAPYTPPVYQPGVVPPVFPGGGPRPTNPSTGLPYYYSNEPKPTNTGYHVIPGPAPVAPTPAPRPVAPPVYTPIVPVGPTQAQIAAQAAANAKAVAAGQAMYQQQQAAAAAAAAQNASKAAADYAAYVASQSAAQPAGVTTAAPTPAAPTYHQQPGTGLWVQDTPTTPTPAPAGVTTAAPPPPPPSVHVTVPTPSYATFPKPAPAPKPVSVYHPTSIFKPALDAIQTMPPKVTYTPPPPPKPAPAPASSAASLAAQIKNLQDRIDNNQAYGVNTSVLEQQLYQLQQQQQQAASYTQEPTYQPASEPVAATKPATTYFQAVTQPPPQTPRVSSQWSQFIPALTRMKALLDKWAALGRNAVTKADAQRFGTTVMGDRNSVPEIPGAPADSGTSNKVSSAVLNSINAGASESEVENANMLGAYFQQQSDQIGTALSYAAPAGNVFSNIASGINSISDGISSATQYAQELQPKLAIAGTFYKAQQGVQQYASQLWDTAQTSAQAQQASMKILADLGLSQSQYINQIMNTYLTQGASAAQSEAMNIKKNQIASIFGPATPITATIPTPEVQYATGAPGPTGQTGQTEPPAPPIPSSWLTSGPSPFTAQITPTPRKTITTQSFVYDPNTKQYRLQEQTVYADNPNMLVKPPTWVPDASSSTPTTSVTPWSPSDLVKTIKDVWNASPYQPPVAGSSPTQMPPSSVPVVAMTAATATPEVGTMTPFDLAAQKVADALKSPLDTSSVAGKETAQELAQVSSSWAQRAGAALPPGMSAPYNQLEWQSPGAMVEPLATVGQDVQDLGEQYIQAKRGLTPYPSYIGPYENVALKVIPPKELLIKGGQLVEQTARFLTPAEKAKAMGWILDVNGNLVGISSGWTMETANAVLKQPLTATQLSELWFAGQGGNTALIAKTVAPWGAEWASATQVSPEVTAALNAPAATGTSAAQAFLNTASKAGEYLSKVPGGSKVVSVGSAAGQKALTVLRVLTSPAAATALNVVQGMYDIGRITYAVSQAQDAMDTAQQSQNIDLGRVNYLLSQLPQDVQDALQDSRRLRQLVNGYTKMIQINQIRINKLDLYPNIDDTFVDSAGNQWQPHGIIDRYYIDPNVYHRVVGPQSQAAMDDAHQKLTDYQSIIQRAQAQIDALTQLQQAKLEAGLP
jgi:hypothetical protein